MTSKRELFAAPLPKPKQDKGPKLWALMQTHRYGQSIVAEVLAPDQNTARSLFDADLHYSKVRGGRFFIARLYCPALHTINEKSDSFLLYLKTLKPKEVHKVRDIVYGKSPSPFPIIPGKPTAPVDLAERPHAHKPNIRSDRTLALYGRRKPRSIRYKRPF